MRGAVIRRSGATPAPDQFADSQPGQDLPVGTLVAASSNPLDVAIVNDQFPLRRLEHPTSQATRQSYSPATAPAAT
jgi:hypothetical protein